MSVEQRDQNVSTI
jgi:hypothetical protein